MRFNTIGYCFKQGFKNIWRNKLFSLASMATMAACIFMFGIFFCIVQNFQHFVREAEEGVAVTVLFDEGTTEDEILEIGQGLTKRDGVSEVVYVSADEAWKSYQEKYFEGNPEVAEAFVDDNPLANSSNYRVYMNNIEKQSELVAYIKTLDNVREVNQSEQAAKTLGSINRIVSYVSVAVIVILLLIAIFLISNTISVGITVRKDEIGIMKYIGATDSFVRAPFLLEGMILGLIGAGIPLIILYFCYNNVVTYVYTKFSVLLGVVDFIPVGQIYQTLVPVALALGIGIQNFPEGAAISLPLRQEGLSAGRAFLYGSASGVVEPVFGILVVLVAGTIQPLMPWLLSFAAGAMMYVVVEELIPEAHLGEHSNTGTLGVMAGFLLMMVLDVALG